MSDPTQENIENIPNNLDVQTQNEETTIFEQVNDTIGGIETNTQVQYNEEITTQKSDDTIQTSGIQKTVQNISKIDREKINNPVGKFKRRNKLPYTLVDFFGLNDPAYLEDITREAREEVRKKSNQEQAA